MRLQTGETIGAYEIVGEVGRGGMATVYKAYHERLDRHVAIKFMHDTFLQDESFHARFQREARIVARLENPHIVPIYDYDTHEGVPYLVMKYIDGMTLKRRAIKTGLTVNQSRDLLTEVARGLDYAHRQGILHRDMKPSNILIDTEDHPYITDFGLARIAEAGSSTISHDMMLGTPYYISPEQARGEKNLDNRTDIYSLGIILYELITGRVPFQADTPYAIVHGHIYQAVPKPTAANPDLPPEVDEVMEKALAKDPSERYATATAMMQAFSQALEGVPDVTPSQVAQVNETLEFTPEVDEPDTKDAAPDFDDLGDEYIRQHSVVRQPTSRSAPSASSAADDEVPFDWRELGRQIQTGAASLAELIEERIDTELRQRQGVMLTDEEIIRRRVRKRLKARREFVGNLTSYILVNGGLLLLWAFTGAGFFWPMFPIFFWGIGVFMQGYGYYSQYGPGADRKSAVIEEAVRRELEAARGSSYALASEEPKEKNQTDTPMRLLDGGGVRLTEDGELTDSFVEEQRSGR
jgi:serine/threonine protein kinase